MRTMRFCRWAGSGLAVAVALLVSCTINKTEITSGGSNGGEGNSGAGSGGVISIAALKAMYMNRPVTITDEISIGGRVISNDKWGNFYKTVYIQDETGGIAVRVDLEDYFKTLPYGAPVTVYCNALTLGTYGGAVQLGILSADGTNTVTTIPSGHLLSAFRITGESAEPEVRSLAIAELSPADINTYVEIGDVQFEDGEAGMPWCDEDMAYTARTLVDRDGNTLDVRTSTYASFAAEIVPGGSGRVRGILGYFNGSYQLTLINSHYAILDNPRFPVNRSPAEELPTGGL